MSQSPPSPPPPPETLCVSSASSCITASASSSTVTVTACVVDQLWGVNVTTNGFTSSGAPTGADTAMLTLPVGADVSRSV
jgi:hypothetical protein